MSRRLVRTDRVRADISDVTDYLHEISPALRARFEVALGETSKLLLEAPYIGHRQQYSNDPRYHDIRIMSVQGRSFRRYLIFYTADEAEVRLLRVLYGAKDIPTLLAENDDTNRSH